MDLAPLPASKKVMQPPLPVLSNQVDTKQPVCLVASQQGIKPLAHKNSQVEMRSWNLDGWSYLYQSEYLGHFGIDAPFQSTQDVKPYPSLPHLPGLWKQRSCTQRSRVAKDSARSDVESEVVCLNHLQSTGNRHLGNMKYNSFSFQGPWKSEPKQKNTYICSFARASSRLLNRCRTTAWHFQGPGPSASGRGWTSKRRSRWYRHVFFRVWLYDQISKHPMFCGVQNHLEL